MVFTVSVFISCDAVVLYQVRLAKIQDDGDVSTTLLGEHGGRAHNLAIEPGSPYIFYSCGEDGLVQQVSH
jgi:WD repeat-containing protein 42A